jgi:hypothetical protein
MDKIKKFVQDFCTKTIIIEEDDLPLDIAINNYLIQFEGQNYLVPKDNYFYGDDEEGIIKYLRKN